MTRRIEDESRSAPDGFLGSRWLPLLLLVIVLTQGLRYRSTLSTTFDEVAHVGAGYAYAARGDFRMNREHPPLLKLLAGMMLLPLDLGDVFESEAYRQADQWAVGNLVLGHRGYRPYLVLDRARIPFVLIGVLCAWLLFRFGATVWNRRAGTLALLLLCGCPVFLGHMVLVTTDVPIATFGLGAILAAVRLRRGYSTRRVLVLATFVAAAILAKFSGPVVAILAASALVLPLRGRPTLAHLLRTFAITLLLTFLSLIACYRGIKGLALYSQGFVAALTRSPNSPDFLFYLDGQFSKQGFLVYFLHQFFFKTPIPILLLIAAGFVSLFLRKPPAVELSGVILPAAFWTVLTTRLAANIGLRYLLPAFPFFFLVAARLAATRRPAIPFLIGLLALLGTTRAVDPIGYHNILIRNGAEAAHYDMSDLDWGQGLRLLGRYLDDRHPHEPIACVYQLRLDVAPFLRGRTVTRVTPALLARRRDLPQGLYAVSTQYLLRYPPLRHLFAQFGAVEYAAGSSLVLIRCPPGPQRAKEDLILRLPTRSTTSQR